VPPEDLPVDQNAAIFELVSAFDHILHPCYKNFMRTFQTIEGLLCWQANANRHTHPQTIKQTLLKTLASSLCRRCVGHLQCALQHLFVDSHVLIKIDQIFCQHLFLSGCCSQNRLIIQFSVLFNSGLTYCNNVGLDQCSYSTLGPVSTWMGDHLWMGKPPWCITRHPGLLSLSLPSMGRRNRVPGKCWGSKQAHCAMN